MRKSGLLVLILSAKLFAQVNAYPPTASAVPSGAAGGDLAGTYPNPTIDLTLAKAWTAIHTFRANAIAATPTERIRLQNQTAATAGVPSQWSPCIYWEGQGWKTDATAASQKVEFRSCLEPVQGTTAPFARFLMQYAINGGAFNTSFSFFEGSMAVGSIAQAGSIGLVITRVPGQFGWRHDDGTITLSSFTDATKAWIGTDSNHPFVLYTNSVERARVTLTGFQANLYQTATNCSSSAAPAVCVSASAGSVVIAAAGTTVTVNTTAVTANSQIFIQEDSSLNTKLTVTCNTTIARTYAVTARTAATSFVIETSAAPVTNPACLSYQIVN